MSLKSELQELLNEYVAVWYGDGGLVEVDTPDKALGAILDLLDKSLPEDVPLDPPFLSRKLWYARRGYNNAIADVRKVIKEDKMSNCCNAQVYDPSGLGIEGRCKDCLEMCLIVKEAE